MDNISSEQKQIATEEGFSNLWPVCTDYFIKEGVLKPNYVLKKLYAPIGSKNLPHLFSRLHHKKDNIELMRFCKDFGHLGRAELAPIRQVFENKPTAEYNETLDWIYAHSKTIDICLEISKYINELNEGKLKEYLSQFRFNGGLKFSQIAELEDLSERYLPDSGDIFGTARNIRRELINGNICRVQRKVNDNKNGEDISEFSFTALIEIIYWILADSIVGGKVKRCQWCGKPFIQTDKRQKFCPISPDTKNYKSKVKDSPCGNAFRMNKRRHPEKYDL